jgi:hypothetical protein
VAGEVSETDHIERKIQQNLAHVMSAEEARRAALIAMGGVGQRKQECREARGIQSFDNRAHDMTYGLRSMRRSPAFTLTALVTLSLVSGANTAIFSLVEGVILRPLPYSHPNEIFHFGWTDQSRIQDEPRLRRTVQTAQESVDF